MEVPGLGDPGSRGLPGEGTARPDYRTTAHSSHWWLFEWQRNVEVGGCTRQTCFVEKRKLKKKRKRIKQVQRWGMCANKDVCLKNRVPTLAAVA